MTKDLEETLRELGPEYRTVVDRLVSAYEPLPAGKPSAPPVGRVGHIVGWSAAYLVAASLLVLVGVAVLFRAAPVAPCAVRTVPTNEYSLAQSRSDAAVAELIRTQNPDGSWKTDYLTRQNAAALKLCPDAAAQIAYRKAMRNLRVRQVL